MSTTRSSRKRQTRLAFTPVPSSSPAASQLHHQLRDRAATMSYEGSPSPAKRRKVHGSSQKTPSNVADSPMRWSRKSSRHGEGQEPTPEPSKNTAMLDGTDEDEEPVRSSLNRSSQKSTAEKALSGINLSRPMRASAKHKSGIFGTQHQVQLDDSSDADDDFVPPTAVRNLVTFGEQSSESDLPVTPARKRHKLASLKPGNASSPLTLDDDDNDELPTISQIGRQKQMPKVAHHDMVSLSSDSDDMPSTRKRLRRGRPQQTGQLKVDLVAVESDSEEDTQPTDRVGQHHDRLTQEERQEIHDDVLDLQSTSDSDPAPRRDPKRVAREAALERLKRRRAGQLSSEEESSNSVPGADNSDDGNGDDEDEIQEILPPTRATRRDMFTQDKDDEGFITDDGVDTLGAPPELPLVFTRYASMKPKELFKFAVEWMVQKKINPAFQTDDEVYDLAFKKLDDEIKGLAGSKFISAAWTQDFSFALRARPQIAYGHLDKGSIDDLLRDKCDACNRSGHPATFEVQFQGKPYHSQTLEPIAGDADDSDTTASDDDDDDDEEEEGPLYDAQGRVIPSEDTIFYVGKHCMANAETAHTLQHWRLHLYEWVVDWLQGAGYSSPAKIVRRDKWSTRKRRKYANKIVDTMEEQGKLKELYRDFKGEIDRARSSKQGRWDNSP